MASPASSLVNSANISLTDQPNSSDLPNFTFATIIAIFALIFLLGLAAVVCWAFRPRISRSIDGYQRAPKGLRRADLRSLPKFTYSSAGKQGPVDDCAICLTGFLDGDQVRELPGCGHCFHLRCIDTWLGYHSSCPWCRNVLVVRQKDGIFQWSSCSISPDGQVGSVLYIV